MWVTRTRYTADQVAADLPGWITAYALYSNWSIGTVSCDSQLANAGDTSSCTVQVLSGTDRIGDDMTGHWSVEVTLQDKAGHIRFTIDGQLAN